MDLRKIPLFRAMGERMAWLSQRQQVLAHNVANANTPGYKPHDLKPIDFAKLVEADSRRVGLQATSARHLGPTVRKPRFEPEQERAPAETLPSGNAVVVEEEMMKVTNNAMQYQLTTSLYRKHVAMIRIALSNPSR